MTKLHSPAPTAVALLLAVPLWLAACDERSAPQNVASVNVVADGAPANAPVEMGAGSGDTAPTLSNDSGPDRPDRANPADAADAANATTAPTPPVQPVGPSEAMKGEKGARAVLLDWARALERGDWARARAQWGHGGADSGLDPAAFAAAYAKYARITVGFGDGEGDAGAGSLYYTVPVTIDGVMKDGRPVHLEGPVTLRRVNDVDGATAEQLSWHISQSDLKPRP